MFSVYIVLSVILLSWISGMFYSGLLFGNSSMIVVVMLLSCVVLLMFRY